VCTKGSGALASLPPPGKHSTEQVPCGHGDRHRDDRLGADALDELIVSFPNLIGSPRDCA